MRLIFIISLIFGIFNLSCDGEKYINGGTLMLDNKRGYDEENIFSDGNFS